MSQFWFWVQWVQQDRFYTLQCILGRKNIRSNSFYFDSIAMNKWRTILMPKGYFYWYFTLIPWPRVRLLLSLTYTFPQKKGTFRPFTQCASIVHVFMVSGFGCVCQSVTWSIEPKVSRFFLDIWCSWPIKHLMQLVDQKVKNKNMVLCFSINQLYILGSFALMYVASFYASPYHNQFWLHILEDAVG